MSTNAKYEGNLMITDENATDFAHITEVTGWLIIWADGASLPALASVSGGLSIEADGASLPALTSVGGGLNIHAEGVELPALERRS